MNHIIWLYLFRIFLAGSVLFAAVTVVLSIRYRLFSMIRSAAAGRRSGISEKDTVLTENNEDPAELPYFAEISDIETDTEKTDSYFSEGNSTIVLDGSMTEELPDQETESSTVILSPDDQVNAFTDPESFVVIKCIMVTYGKTEQIRKFR